MEEETKTTHSTTISISQRFRRLAILRYDYSFIEAAAIRIGDDVLEVNSWGTHTFNGVQQATLPTTMAWFPLAYKQEDAKKHLFTITLDSSRGEVIKISTFKDMVSVAISNPSSANFDECLGMMGEFGTGNLLARDGASIVEDHNLFGQDWQVMDSEDQLFASARIPQYPQACIAPTSSKKERRLGETLVSMEAAEVACAHYEEGEKKDMCVFDVIATNDLEAAEAGVF